jgi:hypothetical protein
MPNQSAISRYFEKQKERQDSVKIVKKGVIKKENAIKRIETGEFALAFRDWVNERALNENEVKVVASPFFDDWMLIQGDLRLSVVVTGAAQLCKSLSSFLLGYYALHHGNLAVLYTFSRSAIRDKIVATTLSPLFDCNREADGFKPYSSDNNKLKKTDDSVIYTSFVYSPGLSEQIAVPAELQSITVDLEILDEYSQYDSKLAAVLSNRMDNSPLFSKAQRFVSTPGKKGTGVDIQLQQCSHVFDAFTECPHCHKLASLNPLDCLLKQIEIVGTDNEVVPSYFDENLRILDWFHHDPDNKIQSAYVACQHCWGEIDKNAIANARLYDRKTQLSVPDYINSINADPFQMRLVGIVAAPILRKTKVSIAVRLITEGINTQNPQNYVEQTLGIPSSDNFDGLTVDLLEKAIKAPSQPADAKEYTKHTVIGLDIARSSHYACVADLFVPNMGSVDYRYENTIRSIRSYDRITAHSIASYWTNNHIDFGFMDLNPDQSLAVELCSQFDMYAAAQKHTLKDMFRHDGEVEAAGIVFDRSYSINNQYFINRIIRGFQRRDINGELIYRLPFSLGPELHATTSNSVVSHFLNMTFNSDKNMWEKGSSGGNRCDWFYSTLFVEVACYYACTSIQDFSWLEFYCD